MSVNIVDLFGPQSGFGTQDVGGGGVYLKSPGLYLLEVVKIKCDKAQAGFPYFLVEFRVIESSHPEIVPGIVVAWMATLKNETWKATFQQNVKGCLLSIVQGVAASQGAPLPQAQQIGDQVVGAAAGDQQPFTGVRVKAQAANIKTKTGGDFTKVTFYPHNEQPSFRKAG
jgi:hypothetical protein